ncbi:MAG TPA: 4-hydroxy-3-methylbut-2-enyl diphosphate reductase [Acidimicrobiales bacterium]|nr:4-hydroxy-3-methylbut-2-enyl diphosphate reductase [Acidimicrobiales bacterium]
MGEAAGGRGADPLTVLTALRIEARAVGGDVVVTGTGRGRAEAAGTGLAAGLAPGSPVAVTGVAGGLHPDLRPGDVMVATELRTADGAAVHTLPSAALLAAELRRSGLTVRVGPLLSSPTLVRSARARAEAAATGAIAVDMESAHLAARLGSHPLAVVRTIADTGQRGLVLGGAKGVAALRHVRSVLESWGKAVGPRDVVLAAPRSFCAGVERAIEIVERALARFGPPVYVRRQIVHNSHVVERLRSMGAVFVQELAEVPDGAVVVIAAHGVPPEVRAEADRRGNLTVVDATCPLVAKVHHEARRYLAQDYQMVLIGHPDHEEVAGTLGEAPDRIRLLQHAAEVDQLDFGSAERVAFLTQTTLATDETSVIVDALRTRFPRIVGPHGDDICYATQNRQDAVRSLAQRCELVLVVGSPNSSNAARLVEVARREGSRAELVEDESDLRLAWLDGTRSIGLTAGASAPELLVQRVLDALRPFGPVTVREHRTTEETVRFSLPQQVR